MDEDVIVLFAEALDNTWLGTDLKEALLGIGSQIVEGRCVVVVQMGQKDGIEMVDVVGEHLHAEVGATVDEKSGSVVGIDEE